MADFSNSAGPILKKFPHRPTRPYVGRCEGVYLVTDDGKKILDATAGSTSYAVLGFTHPDVLDAMRAQMERFCHIDYNVWNNHVLSELAELLLSQAPEGLDQVYFSGNSGSEAIEAATKISYQVHHDAGKPDKTWFISRDQSFHGATLQGIALSELPILDFYQPLLPSRRARIPQHHPLYFMEAGETPDDYAKRGARDLEEKILEIGPDNVCAFIGETILGPLVGNVVPVTNYWKYVRDVCDKYDVHLILDEIYCGNGRSGKIYCCSWDGITPDFVCFGKALAGGYAPLSTVITKRKYGEIIADGQGRIQHGHTHQGHSLGAAAALAVQKVVHREETLSHINKVGDMFFETLRRELGSHPFFRDLRGRGSMITLEYDCPRKNDFGVKIAEVMETEHNILVNAQHHRVSFYPPYIITEEETAHVLERFVDTFLKTAKSWRE